MRLALWMGGVSLLCVLGYVGYLGYGEGGAVRIPGPLLGVWKTSDPKFADRFLEFAKTYVIFGTGQQSEQLHRIRTITTSRSPQNTTVYRVSYTDPEGEVRMLVLTYSADDGGTIQLEYGREIWRKTLP